MPGKARPVCCFAACLFTAYLFTAAVRPVAAQQEAYHPGETYDSLQAGQDSYADAEAQRRALIARQLMIEDQVMRQNTWADPQARYRPVGPESFGPILPAAYGGPTLADAYAYPPTGGGPIYYGGPAAVFEPWPRPGVPGAPPGDIWGTPYYGYVRQPIGHVKIWTSRLGYIYKPIYASPPAESPRPTPTVAMPLPRAATPPPRRLSEREFQAAEAPWSTETLNSLPPPPRPAIPTPARPGARPGAGPDLNLPPPAPRPGAPAAPAGQEI